MMLENLSYVAPDWRPVKDMCPHCNSNRSYGTVQLDTLQYVAQVEKYGEQVPLWVCPTCKHFFTGYTEAVNELLQHGGYVQKVGKSQQSTQDLCNRIANEISCGMSDHLAQAIGNRMVNGYGAVQQKFREIEVDLLVVKGQQEQLLSDLASVKEDAISELRSRVLNFSLT